ncbi:hypothetical protein DL764_002723 [Monosporascus ibericus]|uniref:HAT C-terminal dimerisation domain-containing protein n=1 Tax=Monosporascus ibericus TaxID=155417 RepID=A0A4Q4TJ83_9PEZI|nr:hypothetical protein DL764_002723 [Monosporascus ibericus]
MTRELSRSPSIPDYFGLNTYNPREQALANTLINNFDKKQFRRLLIDWIVERNHPFTIIEEEKLRVIFEYLNPCVKNQDAHISASTVRTLIINAFHEHKQQIVEVLSRSPGLIHIAFDGWRSDGRHSFCGICCFFRDEENQLSAKILDVIDTYGIREKIGYFTLDNAKNNDTAMEVIGGKLGFNGAYRRGRCVGHTLNLSAKALLFGHDIEAFEACIYGEEALTTAEHELWHKKGPVGKLHNLVVIIHRSDKLTNMLRAIQADQIAASSNPRIRAQKPLDVKLDNATRWLSHLYMIRRALALRPFLDMLIPRYRHEWEMENYTRGGRVRRGVAMPYILQAENQLTDHDWEVLKLTADILKYYEDAVKTLEGDGIPTLRKRGWLGSYGNIWDVIPSFEFLLDRLERFKARVEDLPDSRYMAANLNLAWLKLNEYYTKLQETPIYVTALALHPAYRWRWFERNWANHPEWIQHARDQVEGVWLEGYAHMELLPRTEHARPAKRAKRYCNELQRYLEQSRYGPNTMGSDDSTDVQARDALGEYSAWYMDFEPGDRGVQDPIAYWIRRSAKYPRLSKMALDFLTIQPMSAECERLFSAAGRMVNELRSGLDVMLIETCQTLRSWHRAGVINTFDVLFTSPDEARDMAKLQAMTDEEIREWATNWINAISEDEMLDDEEGSLFVAEEGNLP